MSSKIIIIDDDRMVCKALQYEFEDAGFQADWALDGSEGLKKIEENDFMVAIVDLLLPDMDGVRVCQEIKKKHPQMQVILMSGHVNKLAASKKDFLAAGGYKQVIVKPFKKNELINTAREALHLI